eukprot:798886-Amphidinium_carterae.1
MRSVAVFVGMLQHYVETMATAMSLLHVEIELQIEGCKQRKCRAVGAWQGHASFALFPFSSRKSSLSVQASLSSWGGVAGSSGKVCSHLCLQQGQACQMRAQVRGKGSHEDGMLV